MIPGSSQSLVRTCHCGLWATPTLVFSSLDPAPSLASLSFLLIASNGRCSHRTRIEMTERREPLPRAGREQGEGAFLPGPLSLLSPCCKPEWEENPGRLGKMELSLSNRDHRLQSKSRRLLTPDTFLCFFFHRVLPQEDSCPHYKMRN